MHIFATASEDGDDSCEYSKSLNVSDFKGAKLFYKIDGSCGCLRKGENGKYTIYGRLDTRGKPPSINAITLSEGNTSTYKGHSYYMTPRTRVLPAKPTKEDVMYARLHEIVDSAQTAGVLVDDYYSIELVGKNFSATPNVTSVNIALHEHQLCDESIEENFSKCKTAEEYYTFFDDLFKRVCVEGVVIRTADGRYWKVRASMFPDSLWKKDKSKAFPPQMLQSNQ